MDVDHRLTTENQVSNADGDLGYGWNGEYEGSSEETEPRQDGVLIVVVEKEVVAMIIEWSDTGTVRRCIGRSTICKRHRHY